MRIKLYVEQSVVSKCMQVILRHVLIIKCLIFFLLFELLMNYHSEIDNSFAYLQIKLLSPPTWEFESEIIAALLFHGQWTGIYTWRGQCEVIFNYSCNIDSYFVLTFSSLMYISVFYLKSNMLCLLNFLSVS